MHVYVSRTVARHFVGVGVGAFFLKSKKKSSGAEIYFYLRVPHRWGPNNLVRAFTCHIKCIPGERTKQNFDVFKGNRTDRDMTLRERTTRARGFALMTGRAIGLIASKTHRMRFN